MFQRMCVAATGTRMVTSIKPSSVAPSIAVEAAASDTAAVKRKTVSLQRNKRTALKGLTLTAASFYL